MARAAKIPGTPKNFILDNPAALTWGSYGVAFAALLVLVCCQSQSRIYPRNVCILGLFTVCESVFLGKQPAPTAPRPPLFMSPSHSVALQRR